MNFHEFPIENGNIPASYVSLLEGNGLSTYLGWAPSYIQCPGFTGRSGKSQAPNGFAKNVIGDVCVFSCFSPVKVVKLKSHWEILLPLVFVYRIFQLGERF